MVALMLSACSICPKATAAIDDEAKILAVIDQMFEGLRNRDADAWRRLMHEDGQWFIQRRADGDDWHTESTSTIERIMALSAESATVDEAYESPIIMIHGTIATFWAPFKARVDGALVQCGVNSFQLVKQDGNWKIANIMYTAERCDSQPRE